MTEQLMLRTVDFMPSQLLPSPVCGREAHCQEQSHGKWFTLEVIIAKDNALGAPHCTGI